MSEAPQVHASRSVARPFSSVREALRTRAPEILAHATGSAAAHVASLHASAGGIDVGVDVRVHVRRIHDDEGEGGLGPVTHLDLAWEALRAPAAFPVMQATLSLSPVTNDETRLAIDGEYVPPLGPAGATVDRAVGHHVARQAVARLLDDLAAQLLEDRPGA